MALTLQLFDHDNEVVSAKGKGLVSIHAVSISANQPEGDGATVPPTKAGGGKEARMAEKINAQVVPLSAVNNRM